MKVLNQKAHGVLDYLTVLIFALAPSVLQMSGVAEVIAYVLAVVHLLLTLVTAFPLGVAKFVPLSAHGIIELIVSIVLIILPWVAGFTGNSRVFYSGIGVVILIIWLLTSYSHSAAKSTA